MLLMQISTCWNQLITFDSIDVSLWVWVYLTYTLPLFFLRVATFVSFIFPFVLFFLVSYLHDNYIHKPRRGRKNIVYPQCHLPLWSACHTITSIGTKCKLYDRCLRGKGGGENLYTSIYWLGEILRLCV